MSSSVMRELEELRTMLETPRRSFTGTGAITPTRSPELMKSYAGALNTAEKSVDRLGRAIEAAEEEMEAALRRTTEVHRTQLKQRDLELNELQRIIAAKERSLDSLRETIATTKRTYENKLSQVEAALAMRDGEMRALGDELHTVRVAHESAESQLQQAIGKLQRIEAEYRDREAEFMSNLRTKNDDIARLSAALAQERKDKDLLRLEIDDVRREVAVVTDELSYSRAEVTKAKQKDGELAEMRRKLRAERSIRKACEKWLRSELRSREEMESLLGAIKDVAAGRVPSRDMGDVEGLIEEMKMLSGAKASVAGSLDSMRRVLEDDNSRLKAELAAARAMLNDKLRY